jgi:hypothetical protein
MLLEREGHISGDRLLNFPESILPENPTDAQLEALSYFDSIVWRHLHAGQFAIYLGA